MKAKALARTIVLSGAGLLSAAIYMGALDRLHLPQCSKSGKKRVACVGDSITYGCFVAGQPWNSYPRQLGRLLGDDYCVGNFGYTNRTAINTADYPYAAEIYLLLPLPVFPVFGKVIWDIRSDVLEKELLPACRRIAEDKGVTLIETHDVFIGRKDLFVDGCHPNRKGARLLAEMIYTHLKKEQ